MKPLAFLIATVSLGFLMLPAFDAMLSAGFHRMFASWVLVVIVVVYSWTMGDRIVHGRWWWQND